MFTRIQALRFRCLRSVDQELGGFVTLVGPNASGKTTFLDVIALLGDLMRNGGKVADTVLERSPDFEKLLWMGRDSSFQLAVEAKLPDLIREKMAEELHHCTRVRYELEIGMDREENLIALNHEALWLLNGMDRPEPRQPDL
ncbi:MAG: AAA family ATPase, partial [Akkermansiaceae bacterium]|nr:AAA family ATPase [Akkermansiaceae bacterium]